MRILRTILTICVFLASPMTSHAAGKLGLGIAHDMDLGMTIQYQRYSVFFSGDAIALDFRVQNFYSERRTLQLYVDIGGFVDDYDGRDNDRDDSVGVRVPLGLRLGIERNLEVYIQAVPSIDFGNDSDFDVHGAAGIRFRF